MKKTFKRILSGALILCLGLSLSGCVTLDSLRKTHAVFQNEEETVIKLDGVRYKLLPRSPYLNPPLDPETIIRVTDKDVPLLLHRELGHFLNISTDKTILTKNDYNEEQGNTAYCKASEYDDLVARLSEPFEPDCLCYSLYNAGREKFETVVLSPEQQAVIYSVLQKAKPITDDLVFYNSIEIWESSSDFLLRQPLTRISFTEDKIYLGDDEYITRFEIPEQFNHLFEPLREINMY